MLIFECLRTIVDAHPKLTMCLVRGESNKQIARNLDVAESTIKIHVQNILKKLNLSSRVQIAVYAVEHGLDK